MTDLEPVDAAKSDSFSWGRIREDLFELTKARLSALVVVTSVFGYLVGTKTSSDFSAGIFAHLLIGTILSACGAAVFNQLMEVDPDARMTRTSDRPLPAERLPKPFAFILGWLLCAFGIIHLGVKINIMSATMAAATLLLYLFVYTPMKRVSSFNTVIGAISGALPPLIGWCAAGQSLATTGALFLFFLLFLWQLPHFAAINWIYREEYLRGGFKMWSNDDETGRKTGRIALISAVATSVFGFGYPVITGVVGIAGAVGGGVLGLVLIYFARRFLVTGDRAEARRLFFFTLIYLPLMMTLSYLTWR